MKPNRLVLVGNPESFHVGAHFRRAAESLELEVEMLNSNDAFAAPAVIKRLNWWLRGHRPARLAEFGERIASACRRNPTRWMLSTGIAPVSRRCFDTLGELGVQRLNFLTDDPWNPAHRAPWFLEGLATYDRVYSPRSANLEDLRRHGCRDVCHLPFAFDPELHFVEPAAASEADRFHTDVLFAGGADPDRLPWVEALIQAGFKVALYGGYWDRHEMTKPFHRGHADLPTLRKATAGAKVVLGLVRRANRDGHAMRSFEVPAMGGCLLTEETEEHRKLFGPDGVATVYFSNTDEMLRKTRWLLEHEQERLRLALGAHELICQGGHTYRHRLERMLAVTPT